LRQHQACDLVCSALDDIYGQVTVIEVTEGAQALIDAGKAIAARGRIDVDQQ
jgi:hypothetical protein